MHTATHKLFAVLDLWQSIHGKSAYMIRHALKQDLLSAQIPAKELLSLLDRFSDIASMLQTTLLHLIANAHLTAVLQAK